MARARQTAFLGTYKEIHQKKMDQFANEGWIKKGLRMIGKLIFGLIFLGIVFLFFRPFIYKKMGWELPKPNI